MFEINAEYVWEGPGSFWKRKKDCHVVLRRAFRKSFHCVDSQFVLPRSKYGSSMNAVMYRGRQVVEAVWILPERPNGTGDMFQATSSMRVSEEEISELSDRKKLYEYLFRALTYKMGVMGRPSWLAITMLQVDEYFFPVPVNASRSIEALKKEFMDAVPTR